MTGNLEDRWYWGSIRVFGFVVLALNVTGTLMKGGWFWPTWVYPVGFGLTAVGVLAFAVLVVWRPGSISRPFLNRTFKGYILSAIIVLFILAIILAFYLASILVVG